MPVRWRLARRMGGRLSWGVADQAVSSITNFAVNIYIARNLGAVQYGAFGLAYVTYGFALNASRGLATDPLLVRFSGTDLGTWRRAVADCTGTALLAGLGTGACVLAATAFLDGTTRQAFLALGLILPALLLQDSWRFAFFALGRGSQAFLNDMIWAAALFPALLFLRLSGHADVFWLVFVWGGSAAIAAAFGPRQAHVVPKLSGALGWLSRQRDLGFRYMAEGTVNSAGIQLRSYGSGLILGLAALGYLQAAVTLMGPLQMLIFGMGLVALPEAARILRHSPRHMPLFCGLLSAGLTVLALGWGIVLLVTLPKGLGHWLLGPIWRPTYPLVLPTMLYFMGWCTSMGGATWLHALAAARRSLRVAIVSSACYVAFSLVGALIGGTIGSIRGAAAGAWIGALVCWWEVHKAVRESGGVPLGGVSGEPGHEPELDALLQETAPGLADSALMTVAINEQDGHPGYAGQREPAIPPAARIPSFTPATWSAVVALDRTYYDRMSAAIALSGRLVPFPVYGHQRRIPLAGKDIRIGRHSTTYDSDLDIDLAWVPADPGVSRLHAMLVAAPDGTWGLLDLNSANGTLLNGRKIAPGDLVPLHNGDRINLGVWTVITVRRG